MNIFQYFLTRIGFRYLVNMHTHEIHDTHNRKYGCMLDVIRHKKLVTKRTMEKMIKGKYNGCYHCMRKLDKK